MATGIFVVHVPYRGTGPQLTDLMGGRLDAAAVGAPAVLQFIKAGKLRCIATGSTQRLAQLPDVPTVAEQGFPGFEMTQWYGLLAPASLSRPMPTSCPLRRPRRCASRRRPELLENDAAMPIGSTAAEFAAFIAAEQKRWKPVIERARIKPD